MQCPHCGNVYGSKGWAPSQWGNTEDAGWLWACRICTAGNAVHDLKLRRHMKLAEYHFEELTFAGIEDILAEIQDGGHYTGHHTAWTAPLLGFRGLGFRV